MITRLYVWLQTVRDEERGATAVEYGMLVALIAAVVIGTIALLGPVVNNLYEAVTWW
jgi:pilus assembly protein Flp/PilA